MARTSTATRRSEIGLDHEDLHATLLADMIIAVKSLLTIRSSASCRPARRRRYTKVGTLRLRTSPRKAPDWPRMPTNLRTEERGGIANPTTTPRRCTRFLARYVLPRAPGTSFEYSNYGFGLLGELLPALENMSYADASRERRNSRSRSAMSHNR